MKTIKILSIITALLAVVIWQGCNDEESGNMPVESTQKISSLTGIESSSMVILTEELELSDSQAEEVKSILKAHVQEVKNNLPSDFLSLTWEEKKAFFAEERSELKEELKSVLTEEQLDKLMEMRETFITNIKNLLADLNLSEEQKESIAALIKERYESRIWENLSATERKEYRQEFRQELSRILTDEQKEILKKFIQERYSYYSSR